MSIETFLVYLLVSPAFFLARPAMSQLVMISHALQMSAAPFGLTARDLSAEARR